MTRIEDYLAYGFPKTPEIAAVVNEIVEKTRPVNVYLYNQRHSASGAVTGFKLCVVADFADKAAAEREIYLEIDCDVPFDVILYTPAEWKRLCDTPDSFARKIYLTGTVVYG